MKYNQQRFSVGVQRCYGCEQRDEWLRKANEEIVRLRGQLDELTNAEPDSSTPNTGQKIDRVGGRTGEPGQPGS